MHQITSWRMHQTLQLEQFCNSTWTVNGDHWLISPGSCHQLSSGAAHLTINFYLFTHRMSFQALPQSSRISPDYGPQAFNPRLAIQARQTLSKTNSTPGLYITVHKWYPACSRARKPCSRCSFSNGSQCHHARFTYNSRLPSIGQGSTRYYRIANYADRQ